MCDGCADFQRLLESYEARISNNDAKFSVLFKSEIELAFAYIQSWPGRQCMCIYRDAKNFERFNLVVQSMIYLAVHHLKNIERLIDDYKQLTAGNNPTGSRSHPQGAADNEPKTSKSCEEFKETDTDVKAISKSSESSEVDKKSLNTKPSTSSLSSRLSVTSQLTEETWVLPEVEKLLMLVSKVFLLNFPLYLAYKHGTHSRLDDISAEEAQHLAIFCDLHDNEVPVYLLRNICLFCNSGGFAAMMMSFEQSELPVCTAQAITSLVSNVKLWLNYGCTVQLFVPLRTQILQYMCKLSDQQLRLRETRCMADFVWSAVRDPLDASVHFDVEGLTLAYKYFTSTTLTMRLAGMAQINAHINLFNEICATETVGEVEVVGQKIANWLTENQIIQHLFGPNLHVEVIKQAHVVLNFLAVENQITEEHIKLIWQATQLKHCSKTIFDILPSLVKNLAARPAMHLYSLLCRMDPKDHTEQSIYIASALTKQIWSRDSSRSQMSLMQEHILGNASATSSDSGSIEGSNSEEDNVNADDSSVGSGRKSSIDIEHVAGDNITIPGNKSRRKHYICDSTEGKAKALTAKELKMLRCKLETNKKSNRLVNIDDNSSSEEETQDDLHRHRSRNRKSNARPIPRGSRGISEAVWERDEEGSSDDPDDIDGEMMNDSDDCSDSGQAMPTAVLKHLQGEGPYIRAIAETNISELLSGAENDGSYSSVMSNKSEKNMGDFDDEDVSPSEEEIAQLVSTHRPTVVPNCMPPVYAAAAAAMAAAHSAMSTQKTDPRLVAAKAAVVAAAIVANQNVANALNAATTPNKCSDSDMEISMSESSNAQVQQPTFRINDVCQPGNTLLWDLLQDDKIHYLGESLALETEKALATLLCFSMDRLLRTKFIEGCLQNLASNRSVVVSLRLLPKLFASFQQFRPNDTHHVTMWAERSHKMMYHFFNNIKFYAKRRAERMSKGETEQPGEMSLYSHKTEVSVRLHFLSSIYSVVGSPRSFRLSLEQVDALWEWLAHDSECADCYFSWLQSQSKGNELHALGIEALQHLYLRKLPELRPENFSMVALGLFQQLCNMARIALAEYEKQIDGVTATNTNAVGMFHLWKIALRAHRTEVSLAAIQYINMFYMGQHLRLEKEFVSECMDNLVQATSVLESNEDENALMCVQRGLTLLNTHLETFRRRYAYHLRRWAIEGRGIGSLSSFKNEATGQTMRIILQPACHTQKTILHMNTHDLIADLKAEISKWWETLQGPSSSGVSAPVLGHLLSEGPLRIITQGQELSAEFDERSLSEAGFKDNQIVYVSTGNRSARRKETNLDHPSMQPPPPKECLPTVLLLQPKYFEKLFGLMHTLGELKPRNNLQLYPKAQLLSRRVWEILALLPTNPNLLDSFKSLVTDLEEYESCATEEEKTNKQKQIKEKLNDLLNVRNLQKFMYSMHVVESLMINPVLKSRGGSPCYVNVNGNLVPIDQNSAKCSNPLKRPAHKRRLSSENSNNLEAKRIPALVDAPSEVADTSENISSTTNDLDSSEIEGCDKENNPIQICKRQKCHSESNEDKERLAGADNDFSTSLRPTERMWVEVFIKCGGIQHLYEIFISGELQQSTHPDEMINEWRHDCLVVLLRLLWLLGFEELQNDELHMVFARPHKFMLELMEVHPVLHRISSILNDEAFQNFVSLSGPNPYLYQQMRTGFWGRQQIVQFTIFIMVSFVQAVPEAREVLFRKPEYCNWVQKFILEDPEPGVRREVCGGLYRICLGSAQNAKALLAPILKQLIRVLPLAKNMAFYAHHPQMLFSDEGKEPYGPACRDYFWLLSRLVDTLTPEIVKSSREGGGDDENAIDIEELCQSVSHSILTREYYEVRHGYQDDGLVGLINLMSNLIKNEPSFKFSSHALQFIDKIFDFLFEMPSPAYRNKPKCKSATSRAAAYDLLVELCKNCVKNYTHLHAKLLEQHTAGPQSQYPWDYWPREEGRSECGYVGLTNLGATCYMASCIQHLYMMPQARAAILNVPPTGAQKHGPTLLEMQRMFAYLLESERKAYNPRSFCRVYQMDHQPLNTGEQKDMAEFFIDLVSKLEEMTPELKNLVKRLFCGTLSNNVVSLDCEHVSRTAEEFYTVRCQVADMRNLHESLDEVTVKDTLEGDNMYTCSQCGKKVRAEKRACFRKLPQILCFNTMRYTFNMVTMLKEKVNTHFSFPMRLNMVDYVEKTLMPQQYKEEKEKRLQDRQKNKANGADGTGDGDNGVVLNNMDDDEIEECLEYELVGVTVHTGTADGGHYYSFIKERNKNAMQLDRWFLFNDAEVKPFDPSQIAAECFGGEMTSKTYDSVTEKYLDFSFEKTNSAYMLFYERCTPPEHANQQKSPLIEASSTSSSGVGSITSSDKEIVEKLKTADNKENFPAVSEDLKFIETSQKISSCDNNEGEPQPSTSAAAKMERMLRQISSLSKELEDWIWQDNRQFLQDRNIFEHTYFNFMWQICGHIPQTLISQTDVTSMAATLSVSFFIETFIHAKEKVILWECGYDIISKEASKLEKPNMVSWVELLTKQFNSSEEACEWFLNHMTVEPWWPVQVLIQCPNQIVRQMFHRLAMHVIQRLRPSHVHLYLKCETDDDGNKTFGMNSCVTRFITSLITLMEHGARTHLRHLSEFFMLLYDFARLGEEETLFLLKTGAIKHIADFYLGNKTQDCIDIGSDNDDNSSDEAVSIDKSRPMALDKMIQLVSILVERSRGPDLSLRLTQRDYNAIAGGKGFPFLYQQIKDNISAIQTKSLIHALCRYDERLANQIVAMLFNSVTKHTELSAPFFKLLTLLIETKGGPSGLPCFSQLVLQRVWDAAEYCPQSALDWLSFQAPKNEHVHAWILQSADSWIEQFLMAHGNSRVRNAAAFLLASLVPSQTFRTNFRAHKLTTLSASIYRDLSEEARAILHTIIKLLLGLLRSACNYTDISIHGHTKLTAYFSLLSYCMVSKTEKLMVGPYMRALWDLFHPRLSEPSVPTHHSKHALLAFWHHSLTDCPENALIVANCHEITRNIAFNYILADHDESEVVAYNRAMLPAYYGLLRLCCEQSRALTRQLAAHQNLQWAFKNITPHPTQYPAAVEELFKLMTLFATRQPDASEQEKHEVIVFRRTTLSAYLTDLEARVSWCTLINALRILVDNDEDRLLVIYNGGIEMCFDALHTLHSMHHEATACHVAGDLQDLLSEMVLLLATLRMSTRLDCPLNKRQHQQLEQHAHHLQQQQQILQKQQEALKQQQAQTSQQAQQQKEKLHQHLQQQLHLQQMQQHLQHQQTLLRQQNQHTALLKGLPDAIKRLATFLNTFNPPEICRLSLEVLKELVRNPNLDVATILAPILCTCHYTVAQSPTAMGPLGPYFPRRGAKVPWPLSKNTPRPPRPMVQMSIPKTEILKKGTDPEYDALVEAFYRPYHDFVDVMMRMAINTNQMHDSLVKLSCLLAIEAAPLHFNLFAKFWVGIYQNKSTNKYAELLINNVLLREYINIILHQERVSLSDQYIRTFLEIYYPKVSNHIQIARLLYSISYSMHSKEDLDDICGDLFAIRVIAQCTTVPSSVHKQLRGSLRALLNKSARYQELSEQIIPIKKSKEDTEVEALAAENVEAEPDTEVTKKSAMNQESVSPVPMDISIEDVEQLSEDERKAVIEEHKSEAQKDNKKESITNIEEKKADTPTSPAPVAKVEQTIDDASKNVPHSAASDNSTDLEDEPSTSQLLKAKCNRNALKKTAQERMLEEHDKRVKLLSTMESYIKSILTLMEKSNRNSPQMVRNCTDPDCDESECTDGIDVNENAENVAVNAVNEPNEEGKNVTNKKQKICEATESVSTTTTTTTTNMTDEQKQNHTIESPRCENLSPSTFSPASPPPPPSMTMNAEISSTNKENENKLTTSSSTSSTTSSSTNGGISNSANNDCNAQLAFTEASATQI